MQQRMSPSMIKRSFNSFWLRYNKPNCNGTNVKVEDVEEESTDWLASWVALSAWSAVKSLMFTLINEWKDYKSIHKKGDGILKREVSSCQGKEKIMKTSKRESIAQKKFFVSSSWAGRIHGGASRFWRRGFKWRKCSRNGYELWFWCRSWHLSPPSASPPDLLKYINSSH